MPNPITDQEISDLMFVDPAKALALHAERVKAELRGEYQRNQGQSQFWDQFYADNPELRADHDEVRLIINNHMSELAPLPVSKASAKLAEMAHEHIKNKERKRAEEREGAVYVGVPGISENHSPFGGMNRDYIGADDDESGGSLGSIINRRKAARAAGGILRPGRRRPGRVIEWNQSRSLPL
ncbi:hypothetical protein [Rhizobium leguminosarum]|uniref:hypothetical protein n=1 Tax=Rhizobium leguminosarum TaxID=384 RepID=UPI002E130708|nr:hypothetical protein U8Q02_03405 [Rhizobium leguminosarum]